MGILKKLDFFNHLFNTPVRISRNNERIINNSLNKEVDISGLRGSLVTKKVHGNTSLVVIQNIVNLQAIQSSNLSYNNYSEFSFKNTSIMENRFSGSFNCACSITVNAREPTGNSAILARGSVSFGKTEGHISRPIRLNIVGNINRPEKC